MEGKPPPKKRANGNDDDRKDQGRRKSARLATRSSNSAITTETVCHASETGGISEKEIYELIP